MPDINEKQMAQQIKDKRFSPVYFIFGEESYLVSHYAQKLINSATEGAIADLNLNLFEGKNTTVSEIIAAANMLPVMAEKRCVSVKDLNISGLTASDIEELEQYVFNPCPETVLVFWFTEMTGEKNEKFKKLANAARKSGAAVDFKHYGMDALSKMLCLTAAKRGSRMQTSAARYLIECCGNDLFVLLNELDKLCAYRMGQEIMPEDIDLLTTKTLGATAFNIVKAVRKNQADTAFLLLDTLYKQRVKPTMILGAVSSAYINMYRMKAAGAEGIKPAQMAQMLGAKKTYALELAQKDAAAYSKQSLKRCVDILLDADITLKQSPMDDRIVIERAITRLLWENGRKDQ